MSYAAVAQVPLRQKSPEAFRTISEVAVELDVPQHVLRFWESRFSHIKPVKRAGGRRYYRPEDVDLLRGIRTLLYADGYTIKGVQKVLRDKGARFVAEVGREGFQDTALVEDRAPVHRPRVVAEVRRRPAPAILAFERRGPVLEEQTREQLEILLAELVQMKGRLRAAPRPV